MIGRDLLRPLVRLSSLVVTTAPTAEPVSLDEAKAHLRVKHSSDDAYITALIKAARSAAENYCHRAILQQTLVAGFDIVEDTNEVPLPIPRIISVDLVQVYDDSDTLATVDSGAYFTDLNSEPGRLFFTEMPSLSTVMKPVLKVTYKAGYGTAATSVPPDLIHAIKELIHHFYGIRAPVITGTIATEVPLTYRHLLNPFKLWRL